MYSGPKLNHHASASCSCALEKPKQFPPLPPNQTPHPTWNSQTQPSTINVIQIKEPTYIFQQDSKKKMQLEHYLKHLVCGRSWVAGGLSPTTGVRKEAEEELNSADHAAKARLDQQLGG
jgi:hypothetical protein